MCVHLCDELFAAQHLLRACRAEGVLWKTHDCHHSGTRIDRFRVLFSDLELRFAELHGRPGGDIEGTGKQAEARGFSAQVRMPGASVVSRSPPPWRFCRCRCQVR